MRRAAFQRRTDVGVVCLLCPRRCALGEGDSGFCRARTVEKGVLYARTYGCASSLHIAPSEIKPFFHYKPGALWLSVGSLGCNLRCPGCQNYHIAHSSVSDEELSQTERLTPDSLVGLAVKRKTAGLSFTYNEPIIWSEFLLDAATEAHHAGLAVNLVTNGYATPKAWRRVLRAIDAVRMDVKGYFKETTIRVANMEHPEVVRRNAEETKAVGLHLEIITNLVPTLNDDEDELCRIADWIVEKLGDETPWHLTRFVPHLELSHLPSTPLERIEAAMEIAERAGLKFVYSGNIWGHRGEKTYCPDCGAVLIERYGCSLQKNRLKSGKCPDCGRKIPVIE